jgi:photosystem II stability/assembly factor-like uncharacterized protein
MPAYLILLVTFAKTESPSGSFAAVTAQLKEQSMKTLNAWTVICFVLAVCTASGQDAIIPGKQSPGRPREPEVLRRVQATFDKVPLVVREMNEKEEGEGSFLQYRLDNYVRPRAFPMRTLDARLRHAAHQRLKTMRSALNIERVRPSFAVAPAAPGATGYGGCAWRSVGPTNINGRITSIAIDPSNHDRVFVTTVGGIWRSTDAARRWQRVSEDFLSTVFASIVVNPGNGNEIIAGGGDPNYASATGELGLVHSGIGIWRSTAGGDPGTWTKVSPPELDNQVVFRLRLDPAPPHNIYAATTAGVYMGSHTATGVSWSRVANFGAWTTDLAVDFSASPRKLYAGVAYAGPNFANGVWKYDGTSWQKRDDGIPTAQARTIALGLAVSDPAVLYAKVEQRTTGLLLGVYKTTTAAESPAGAGSAWSPLAGAMVMDDSKFGANQGYSWYNSMIEVDPTDPNRVYAGGMNVYRTTDGGVNWPVVSGGADATYPYTVHADQHSIAFDPVNPKIVYLGGDGGLNKTTDTSSGVWHWQDVSHGMVLTEFFKVTTQQSAASLLAGGSQDNGTEITFGNRTWFNPFGCDGRDVAVDSRDGDTLYLYCNSMLFELANPVPGTVGGGDTINFSSPPDLLPAPPVVTDPVLPRAALALGKVVAMGQPTGATRLIKTTDGITWSPASPMFPGSASLTTIVIAPSSSFQTYYLGLSGGPNPPTVWHTADGGQNWDTTPNGLPTNLQPNGGAVDSTDPKRAFMAFGGFGGGSVRMTTDGGKNWISLDGSGASALPGAAVLGLAIDPANSNLLYAATSVGVLRGQVTPGAPPTAAWAPFDEGLPDGLDVNDIVVNRATGLLTIGTMGHGAYQRDIRPGVMCPPVMLLVRDNVFDRGTIPSPDSLADPEHPITDPTHAGFYKPDDTPGGLLHWWNSTDIRIDVPSVDPPANQIPNADSVEMESCPIRISDCPPGTLMDSEPVPGKPAKVYIQVTNQGVRPASNVRVIALWTDATTTLPLLPDNFWTVTFRATGQCGPLTGGYGWNLVDVAQPCRTVPVVNPDYPETVRFDWNVPQSSSAQKSLMVLIESQDDPIDPSVRASNERRPWVLVPNHRQIALRNMHVINVPPGPGPFAGLNQLRVTGPAGAGRPLDLVVSRAATAPGDQVSLVVPELGAATVAGLQELPAPALAEHKRLAAPFNLEATRSLRVTGRMGRVENLVVPRSETLRLGVHFEAMRPAGRHQASRFSVVVKQGDQVLGGSTYILRPARRAAPNP